jgi:CDP-glucose 4,6-dehydratase
MRPLAGGRFGSGGFSVRGRAGLRAPDLSRKLGRRIFPMLDRSFWAGRRVFLTGHTGFKGSWLSLWLHALGAEVAGYALAPPTTPSLFAQAGVARMIRSTQADIRDFARLKSAIAESRPEVVLHLAAQSVVRRGYEDPMETYSTNVMGTVHLLEALRQLDRSCVVVNVTSDKCYANREWAWGYRETDRLGGHDPYSNSKACAELVSSAYCDSYFHRRDAGAFKIAVATARAGNVVGGGDWTRDQLIPDLMRSFLEGRPCLIRNPSAIRPWQFVLEPLHGYLLLAERLAQNPAGFASAWNFGPAESDARPVAWIAGRLAQLWGKNAAWRRDVAAHPPEAHYLKLDTSRARTELGWEPVVPLADALERIVEWYELFQQGGDLGALTRNQIEKYESLLLRPNASSRTIEGKA